MSETARDHMPAVMTVPEAAEFLRLSPHTIRAMFREGVLEGNQRGHAIRLLTASVVAWARGKGASRTGTDP